MWLFTRYGFFSAVCTKEDPSVLKVRARDVDHLAALRERLPDLLGGFEISESTNADYRCRMIVPKAVWAKVCEALAEDVNYDNFKSEVAAYQGATDYEHALHGIWSIMYGTQVKKYGQGIYSYQNRKHGAKSLDEIQAEAEADGEQAALDLFSGETETEIEIPVEIVPAKRGNRRGGKKS